LRERIEVVPVTVGQFIKIDRKLAPEGAAVQLHSHWR
jgi:hypothetical protein